MLNKLMCKIAPKDRKKYKELIKVSAPLLEKMQEVIDKSLKDLENSEEDFSKASWAYEQAFKLGYKKGLTELKKYVIIDDEE